MSTEQQSRQDATSEDYAKQIARELERIGQRRRVADARPQGQENSWALSLSGGGIRSATFCLGVLQALSRAPAPPGSSPQAPPSAKPAGPPSESSLLGQIDYLSTVSGGGYIGTFFASLFVPGRADPKKTSDEDTAAVAYETLRENPGRLRTTTVHEKSTSSAHKAMCWLRENGRYMAPSSAGDLIYGAAVVLRGWFGLHFVVGLSLLLVLALLNLLKNGLLYASGKVIWTKFIVSLAMPGAWMSKVWLSGLWIFPVLLLALLAVPSACAYWLTYPPPGQDVKSKAPQSWQFWAGYLGSAAIVGLAMAGSAGMFFEHGQFFQLHWNQAATPFAVVFAEMLLAAAWFLGSRRGRSFAEMRVRLTRQLAWMLKAIGVLIFLSLADTFAQSFYIHQRTVAMPLTAAGVLTWLVRRIEPHLGGLQNSGRGRIPLEVLVTGAALLLAVLLATVWDYAVIWLQWQGQNNVSADPRVLASQSIPLLLLLVAAGMLTVLIGNYPQFLNLSSLQNLYSARLTRAYQGASNAERFADGDKSLSSAEALDSDHISHKVYNSNPLSPLHIINICLNQNVDPAEQLVQRDRKGRSLAILPGAIGEAGLPFAIDGKFHMAADLGQDNTLTMGEWIGVSGAAAGTGSGRQTSASLALLLGLANVRLGRWWCSQLGTGDHERKAGFLRSKLPTQAYLADELSAHFYGTRRAMQYLSDGGHFENLGIYELLREQRQVKLVIACDCGADPLIRFDDLANLIRLARIDFGLEIQVDESVTGSLSQLRHIFGTPEELAQPQPGSNKCAMLLNVYRKGAGPDRTPDMRIVLIKPVLIAGAPLDVHNYGAQNKDFPQQTTGDQFFDEAQWESYRKLGMEIGRRIFDSADALHHQQLWNLLLR
jgi:hypothetical protein